MSEKLLVPDIGEFEKVEVIELLVKVGDQINLNDPVVTIESDKSSVEIPSTVSGKVDSVNIKVGDKVSKGDILLSIESSKENLSEKPIPKDTESIIKQAESVLKNEKKEATTQQSSAPEKKQTIIQVTNENDIIDALIVHVCYFHFSPKAGDTGCRSSGKKAVVLHVGFGV